MQLSRDISNELDKLSVWFAVKGALYRIWWGVSRLGDIGVNAV